MEIFKLDSEFIKLGQLLKAVGFAESGVHAKIIIANGQVCVNDEVVYERGKKIKSGDVVKVEDEGIVKVL